MWKGNNSWNNPSYIGLSRHIRQLMKKFLLSSSPVSKDKALNQSDIWLHTCSWWTKCTETTGLCSISPQPWSINSTFQIAMSNGSKQQVQKNCRIGWYVVFQPPTSNVIHLKSQFNGVVEVNNQYAIVIGFLESCFFSWVFPLFLKDG